MGKGMTVEFDERWMADKRRVSKVLHVQPSDSVVPDLWDVFDGDSKYVNTFSGSELAQILRLGDVTVVNRYSGAPWSPSQEKSRRKRKCRKPGKRKTFSAYYTRKH